MKSLKHTFIISILLILTILPVWSNSCFAAVIPEEKTIEPENFTFTAGDKIIGGKCLKKNGETWITATLAVDVMKSVGAGANYSSGENLLVLNHPSINKSGVALPPASSTDFRIVINGSIHKTASLKNGNEAYIPIKVLVTILESSGRQVEIDNASNLAAVSGGTKAAPIASPSPSPVPVEKSEAVKKYMDDLKKVFLENRPGVKEMGSLDKSVGDENFGITNPLEALKKLRVEQEKFLVEIKKLSPPDEETKEIHRLALDIVGKMLRVSDLGIRLLSTPRGQDNPKAAEELIRLNREIKNEEADFNNRVIHIRQKYKIGPP